MATIADFNAVVARDPVEALQFAERTMEPQLRWAANMLRAGKWRLNGVLVVLPAAHADRPHTIAEFNRVLATEGEDAALSFAAWSGEKKLEWAASKLRAGEWTPGETGNSYRPAKLPPRIGKTDREGGKTGAEKRRSKRRMEDRQRWMSKGRTKKSKAN